MSLLLALLLSQASSSPRCAVVESVEGQICYLRCSGNQTMSGKLSVTSLTTPFVDAGIVSVTAPTAAECAIGVTAVDNFRAICLDRRGGLGAAAPYIAYNAGTAALTVANGSNAVNFTSTGATTFSGALVATSLTASGTGDITVATGGAVYVDGATHKRYVFNSGELVLGVMGTSSSPGVNAVGTANSNTTPVGNVGASGPDDLQTYSLPANALTTTGRCLRVTAIGNTANNANAKTVRLVIGPGPSVLVSKQLTASVSATWQLNATVCRTGASAQVVWATGENSGGTTISTTDGTTVSRIPTVVSTLAETETAALTIKTQSTASTSDNDIVSQVLIVEFI